MTKSNRHHLLPAYGSAGDLWLSWPLGAGWTCLQVCHELYGVPSDSHVEVLTTGDSEGDHIWRLDVYRRNQVKLRTQCGPYSNVTGVLETGPQRWGCSKDTGEDGQLPGKEESRDRPSIHGPGGARPNSLQSHKQTQLCDSHHPVCSAVLWKPWETKTDSRLVATPLAHKNQG